MVFVVSIRNVSNCSERLSTASSIPKLITSFRKLKFVRWRMHLEYVNDYSSNYDAIALHLVSASVLVVTAQQRGPSWLQYNATLTGQYTALVNRDRLDIVYHSNSPWPL